MSPLPRRSLASLAAEAIAEKRTLIALVEGPSDKLIIRDALARIGKSASFYCVPEIEIPSPPEDPVRGGDKGRLLRAIAGPTLKPHAGANLLAVVDDDGDRIIGETLPKGSLSPMGASLTTEILAVYGMASFVTAVAGRAVPENEISACVDVEREIFSIKLALKKRSIDIPDFSTKALSRARKKGGLNRDYIQIHLESTIQNPDLVREILDDALVINQKIPSDLHGINCHRLFSLMSKQFHVDRIIPDPIPEAEWTRSARVTAQALTTDNAPTIANLAQVIDVL